MRHPLPQDYAKASKPPVAREEEGAKKETGLPLGAIIRVLTQGFPGRLPCCSHESSRFELVAKFILENVQIVAFPCFPSCFFFSPPSSIPTFPLRSNLREVGQGLSLAESTDLLTTSVLGSATTSSCFDGRGRGRVAFLSGLSPPKVATRCTCGVYVVCTRSHT